MEVVFLKNKTKIIFLKKKGSSFLESHFREKTKKTKEIVEFLRGKNL